MATFCAALRRAGATVVQELSHSFPETGLTCVLILSESHAVLHTWPETGTVNIDIFSCSTRLKSLEAIDELRRSLRRATCHRAGDPPCRRTRRLGSTDAVKFALRAVAWSLGFFGLLRLNWFEAHRRAAGHPRAEQGWRWAVRHADVARRGHACVQRRRRVGAVPRNHPRLPGDVANAPRRRGCRRRTDPRPQHCCGSARSGQAAASPAWFNTLHVYVWPAVLTLAIAGYVFTWMRLADRRASARDSCQLCALQPSRRFVVLTAAFLLAVRRPPRRSISRAPAVLALAGFIARAAAAILGVGGVTAYAAANVLWTPRGGFLVTQECISTPLVPVYLAAICAYSTTWRRLILGVLATLPLFIALGIVRLLVVALPDAVGLAAVLRARVLSIAPRRGGRVRRRALAPRRQSGARSRTGRRHRRACCSSICSVPSTRAWSPIRPARRSTIRKARSRSCPRSRSVSISRCGSRPSPPLGWRRFLAGLAVLGLTQSAGLLALHALASHAGVTAARARRPRLGGCGPVLIFAAVVTIARTRR